MTQLALALEAGRLGMERAADRAERAAPGWKDVALGELRRFARVQPEPFTIEQARAAIVVPDPPDARAWGAVTQAAIRRGFLYRTGRFAPASSSHGAPKPLYRGSPSCSDWQGSAT